MALTNVMTNALSGMRVTQAGLDVVSQNISNADSAGYVRRRANIIEQPLGDQAGYARNAGVQRLLDRVVQRQLWNEMGAAGYTSTRADMMRALDQLYGPPDSDTTLGAVFGRFTQSLQQLKSDPASTALRTQVTYAAQDVAGRLRSLSGGVQDLRLQADQNIGAAVGRANQILTDISATNAKIIANSNDTGAAALRDQRDRLVTELAGLFDIKTSEGDNGSLTIFTTSGVTLFTGSNPVRLTFQPAPNVTADMLWNADPAVSTLSSIRASNEFGGSVDLIAANALRGGELAALVELRDRSLVQAQNQLDEFAANMASALSDREVAGVAVNPGPGVNGFDVDTTGLLAGNQIALDYTDATTGQRARFTFVRADSAAGVAAVNAAGLSSGDNRLVGIDFSGGMAGVVTQIQAAVGAGFTVSNAGATLRIVNNGGTRAVNGLTASPTTTGFSAAAPNGVPEAPFFSDSGVAGGLYTGSFEAGRPQMRGLSARIEVNPLVLADRARLVQFQTGPGTPQGDQTRLDRMYSRLTSQIRSFSPQTGVAGASAGVRATVQDFAQRIVETQGAAIQGAASLNEGQQIALKSMEARFSERSGVNIDQEMASLIELQNAYAANARLISAAKEMMDLLLRL